VDRLLRETFTEAVHGRLTSSALIVIGTGAAYVYSALAVIEGTAHVYFDTQHVLHAVHLGPLISTADAQGGARPGAVLAAES